HVEFASAIPKCGTPPANDAGSEFASRIGTATGARSTNNSTRSRPSPPPRPRRPRRGRRKLFPRGRPPAAGTRSVPPTEPPLKRALAGRRARRSLGRAGLVPASFGGRGRNHLGRPGPQVLQEPGGKLA